MAKPPFSYRFPISEHSDGVKSSVIKEAEVNEVQDATVATGPNNATVLYANGVAECVRVISVPESKHLVHIEALDDVSEDEQDSGSEEMLVSSNPGLTDGGSADSESMPACNCAHWQLALNKQFRDIVELVYFLPQSIQS